MRGGFFERLMSLIKVSLRNVLGNSKLTFDELRRFSLKLKLI